MKDTLIVLTVIIGLCAVVGIGLWLSPVPLLRPNITPEVPESFEQRFERETAEQAKTPVQIGDLYPKVVKRCGLPDDTANVTEKDKTADLLIYEYRKDLVFDCVGSFYFINYRLTRIVR